MIAICGWFADHSSSRRLPLLFGLLALGGSTLLLCLGRTLALLIVARVMQGISAAAVYTVGLALLVDTVGPNQIAEMAGYVSLSMTLAIMLSPSLGGIVYHAAGYYAVFYMSFGMIILDIIFRTVVIEKKIAKQWDPIEAPILHESDDLQVSETSPPRSQVPIDPEIQLVPQASQPPSSADHRRSSTITLLSSRRLWSGLYCSFAQAVLITAWDATVPLRVHKLFGWNSLGAGLIFIPFVLPDFFAPFVGMYIDKHGPRLPAAMGFLLCVPPLVLLRLVDHGGIRQIVLLCALFAMTGFALTITIVPFLAEVAYVVAAKEKARPGTFGPRGAYAQAFGIYNSAFALGMMVGPLWAGGVVTSAGWGTMTLSVAILSAVSAVPALLWTGGWIIQAKNQGEESREVETAANTSQPVATPETDAEKVHADHSTIVR